MIDNLNKPVRWPKLGEEVCTEFEVTALVNDFCERVRHDALLGAIFKTHVEDWDRHLAKLVDFWSAILRRTGRFSGDPMAMHAALPGLSNASFQHWLQVFRENAAAQPNAALRDQACAVAERIAEGFWRAYSNKDALHAQALEQADD
ncbi:MAG: group III truncated hemoglobin [Hyphomicrobiales bacterium]|nr:MAG: group III truncated hemoglobin [Hyphomicrobiales bacterium]